MLDWDDITLLTNNQKQIILLQKVAISIWTPTSLTFIEDHIQCDIQIMGRVLDHIIMQVLFRAVRRVLF